MSAARTGVLARAVWGGGMLLAPRLMLRILHGGVDDRSVAILRLLGTRHLLQAAVTAWCPTRPVYVAGAAVDALHALSAVALAVTDRRQRPPALAETALAAAWIVVAVRPGRVAGPR
ncbi:hypothetical protein ACN27G_16420 [Plantactinospora sp. WMMB334]|uniref:hypothetical protein n=1 Tax=Plantactinospora sp. WMMB334 TaxID=3404119 RepID=UPI003B9457DA